MSISKAIILIGIMLAAIVNITPIATATIAGCTNTVYGVPGDTVTLTGPVAPTGVVYTYQWTITDASGATVGTPVSTQSTTFTIPSPSTSFYTATLLVGSGTANSQGYIAGCVMSSCVTISVESITGCSISGSQTVCQTETDDIYTWTGTADIGNHKTAYLTWFVDSTTSTPIKDNDNSGQVTVDWTKIWDTTKPAGSQTHNVIVQVKSTKSKTVLSTCSYTVTVLPTPVTTISAS